MYNSLMDGVEGLAWQTLTKCNGDFNSAINSVKNEISLLHESAGKMPHGDERYTVEGSIGVRLMVLAQLENMKKVS